MARPGRKVTRQVTEATEALAQRVEGEVDQIRRTLSNLIDFSSLSRREVGLRLLESDCGSDIGRLLSGRLELKMKHVLAICRVIDLEPAELLQIALKPRAGVRSPLVRRIEALQPFAKADPGSPEPSATDLKRRLQELAEGLNEVAREVARLDPLRGASGNPAWDVELSR
jgi:hypothetical protein